MIPQRRAGGQSVGRAGPPTETVGFELIFESKKKQIAGIKFIIYCHSSLLLQIAFAAVHHTLKKFSLTLQLDTVALDS